ncbi:class I SAM-dependent methyltransferase [Acaryochloris sp. IP29b_bin.148]|uniref:class I SAM-dependent methyltransferase n=1 Tax=Acaryochloris sp. IP29b_bin.148 TaxID=2969218 RepID=UPI00260B1695|nr:class I SAM-dependent methyltransferase [Acaryochloris sp. IP29b_bin.148]
MVNAKNLQTYESRGIVQYYAQLQELQAAEAAILAQLNPQLPTMSMLDMGVGGGRTTLHFAKQVANYIGIDYSANMIQACQQRFADAMAPDAFTVCDARDMSCFADNTFDFILFSFNGIDYIEHCDRIQVLQEIQRVGKPGGYFCFSTHNLQGMEQLFDWRSHLSYNPIRTYIDLFMWAFLRGFNRSCSLKQLHSSVYAMIRDEPHNFRLRTYHIRPQAQLEQLASGFTDIKVYSWQDGTEINPSELPSIVEMWLYYLCVIQ